MALNAARAAPVPPERVHRLIRLPDPTSCHQPSPAKNREVLPRAPAVADVERLRRAPAVWPEVLRSGGPRSHVQQARVARGRPYAHRARWAGGHELGVPACAAHRARLMSFIGGHVHHGPRCPSPWMNRRRAREPLPRRRPQRWGSLRRTLDRGRSNGRRGRAVGLLASPGMDGRVVVG